MMSFPSSFQGRGRGGGQAPRRGQGRGGRAPLFVKRGPVMPDLKNHPLGDLVKTLRNSDLSVEESHIAKPPTISDCRYVASYNWSNDPVPTIIVPGKPPLWTPLQTPRRLNEDSGVYFRDPNAAKYPENPMAPVVHAILAAAPEFDTTGVDLFACGSTLGSLLRFARGVDKAFRFNVEMIGRTVFFIRKENDPREVIQDVRGFGHTFPEAYTTWEEEVKGSDTHQRIVQYKLGDLQCLLRFESDGYIKDPTPDSASSSAKIPASEDDVLQALQSTTITRPTEAPSSKNKTITVKHAGSAVPQHRIFDLKTRSRKHGADIDISDIYPVLWLKQIPNFIVAYHNVALGGAGIFQDIRVLDVQKDVQAWEESNTDGIHRLAVLLEEIIAVVKEDEGRLLEIYCPGADRLEIRVQYGDGVHALPMDLNDRWMRSGTSAETSDDEDDGGLTIDSYISDDDDHGRFGYSYDADSDDEPDYTACSAHDCGYCGKCTY